MDFALFVLLCFSVPFDPNPRMFALSTHVSFMMTFVNPSADGFSTEPTYATDYLSMILAASVMPLGLTVSWHVFLTFGVKLISQPRGIQIQSHRSLRPTR